MYYLRLGRQIAGIIVEIHPVHQEDPLLSQSGRLMVYFMYYYLADVTQLVTDLKLCLQGPMNWMLQMLRI